MIPTCEELVEAYHFLARRQRLEERARRSPHPIPLPLTPSTVAIKKALSEAARLLDAGIHVSAALVYAFGQYPRCFPLAWYQMTDLLAKNAARKEGVRLRADAQDMRDVVYGVASRQMTPDDVDAWVRDRLEPIE